jgi:hypothetical protein
MTWSTPERPPNWSAISCPRRIFAAVYAKPLGRPLVDTFITEVSQDTWISSVGHGARLPAADPGGRIIGARAAAIRYHCGNRRTL